MTDQNIRQELLSLWDEIKSSGPEGLLEMADDLISKHPECADVFIEKFIDETNLMYKELLAQLILYGVHYQPAIEFLRDECGWDDFTGYAGFPES